MVGCHQIYKGGIRIVCEIEVTVSGCSQINPWNIGCVNQPSGVGSINANDDVVKILQLLAVP